VLEVDSRAAGAFGRDDVNFLQTYANLLGAAILRHRSHDLVIAAAVEKARSAQENEILLRELQHRVMNNLQVITSLISIQQRRIRSREAADALKVIASRVETLRLLHERLYTARQMDMIDLADYLASLCATLVGFHREEVAGVTLSTRLAPIMASADTAVPLGLIVNEFVTNSLKHAFPGGKGTIRVGLAPLKEESGEGGGRARLDLADDGAGLRDPGHGARGSGLHLIRMLGTQIGAAIIWNEGGGDADTGAAGPAGTSAQVVFPLKR
jgi:two-component sensor histidine kinase